jgi:translocator protein
LLTMTLAITISVAALITIAVLFSGAKMTTVGPWYRALRKPWWNPPEWLFGPAWTVILTLAAWAGVEAWTSTDSASDHWRIAILYGVYIVFHTLWTPLFFNLKRPDWALYEVVFLWLSAAALVVGVAPISTQAGLLLLTLVGWITFAAYLNLVIVRLNGPFGSGRNEALPASG